MRSRAAARWLAAGAILIAIGRIVAPGGGIPLYDGVVVQDPYRYLVPGQNQVGSPTSASVSQPVSEGTSPRFAAATSESPPQAQLIAPAGAFVMPQGTSSLTVSITPVAPAVLPAGEELLGNVYRFSATDQLGTPLSIAAAAAPTLVLRAPLGVVAATMVHLSGTSWLNVPAQPAGLPGIFVASVTQLGEFALIATRGTGPLGLDPPMLLGGAAIVLVVVLLLASVAWRGRRATIQAESPRRPTSKRRRGPRQGGTR